MSSSISIVVPVFNQAALTERCLHSLLVGSQVARELIVVDNHSTDNTSGLLISLRTHFEKKGWKFQVITNEKNAGFGRACNQGIRASTSPYVAVLNNDTWLMPGWDQALLRRIKDLNAAMIGPYYDETPFDAVQTARRAQQFVQQNRGKARPLWVSILMFFRRADLEQVGLFDERFFVTYEDTDLRERFDRAGLKYFMVGDCSIWHFSKGTRNSAPLPQGYEADGLRLFMEKWNFDPRARDHTRWAKLRRRWMRMKNRWGRI